jgi:hypothetical protein
MPDAAHIGILQTPLDILWMGENIEMSADFQHAATLDRR